MRGLMEKISPHCVGNATQPITTSLMVILCIAMMALQGCSKSSKKESSTTNPPIIENVTFTSRLLIEGAGDDNIIVRNSQFIDIDDDAILIRDANNVTIENCTFSNCGGLAAIRLSSYGSSNNVVIRGNTITDSPSNAIVAGNYESSGYLHTNLKIIDNTIHNSGLESDYDGLTHHIYVQAPDALIEGNTMSGTRDGNGISIRSSGQVRNNTISGHSLGGGKSAIRYYSDHRRGPSNRLVIENNMVDNLDGPSELITLINPADHYNGESGHVVENFVIRFNTSVSTQALQPPVRIGATYANSPYHLSIYGNLLVNTVDSLFVYADAPLTPDIMVDNLETSTLALLVGNGDFHLQVGHPAIGGATQVPDFPADDIDGQPRSGASIDIGADQLSDATAPFSNQ